MNSRLILVVDYVIQRKWMIVTDVLARNLTPVICRYREQKIHHYLHKTWDMSYSQCRSFHHSSLLYKRRKTKEEKKTPRDYVPPLSKHKQKKVIEVWKNMTVKELANSMALTVDELFDAMDYVPSTDKYFKDHHIIDDFNVIQAIVKKVGHRWMIVSKKSDNEQEVEETKDAVRQPPPDPSVLVKRNPVVTIMGHVDHGKTTLLDTLRHSSIVEREFGGITQHIGAFSVRVDDTHNITFLDTPGHAAFSAMRSRGANVTDIVILVVAADDGVMEQTDESIRMAREAKVPIIVAINKIDKPNADIERTKNALNERGLMLEGFGGDIQCIPISALKNTNIDALVDAILAQAEVMELKCDPKGLCEGAVIEAKHDMKRGKLATVLVQRGTLKKGTIVVAGLGWAKVRLLSDDNQKVVKTAEPSSAVEVLGWRELPSAGDLVLEVETEQRAREVMRWRESQKMKEKYLEDKVVIDKKAEEHEKAYKEKLLLRRKLGRFKLKPTGPREKMFQENNEGPHVNIIIKGDVDGSVEAIIDILATYRSSLCKLDVVHFEVGSVSLSDIELADSFNAVIYAFNVDTLPDAKDAADQKDVRIRYFNVIYKLVDDLKDEINRQLPAAKVEEIIGEAKVLQQFIVTERRKQVPVAGCKCVKGELKRRALYKIYRNGELIYQGDLQSLRHLKTEVESISTDMECGIRLADKSIFFEADDKLICYLVHDKQQVTDWNPGF